MKIFFVHGIDHADLDENYCYAFTVEGLKALQPAIPFCILALMLSAVYGLAFGVTLRGKNEDFQRKYDKDLLHYQNVELEVEKARKLKELGLQPDLQRK